MAKSVSKSAFDTVLVTGSTGFIGSHLVRFLRQNSYAVFGLVRRGVSTERLRTAVPGVKLSYGDILSYPSLVDALSEAGPDVVIHLAGRVRRAFTGASSLHAVNEVGTENVCRACAKAKVTRLVLFSSADVHGPKPSLGPLIDEEWPYRPTDEYAESKVSAERIALHYHERNELEVVIIRPTHVYGPGDPSSLPKLMTAIERLPFIPMLGDGRTLKHFVYVDDLLNATLLAMTHGVSGEAYIIADGAPVTLESLFGLMARVASREKPVIRFTRNLAKIQRLVGYPHLPLWYPISWFYTNRAYSIARARRELRYKPTIDLETGLRHVHSHSRPGF
jgi:nucleoside-diphosphate-sugar epimerase